MRSHCHMWWWYLMFLCNAQTVAYPGNHDKCYVLSCVDAYCDIPASLSILCCAWRILSLAVDWHHRETASLQVFQPFHARDIPSMMPCCIAGILPVFGIRKRHAMFTAFESGTGNRRFVPEKGCIYVLITLSKQKWCMSLFHKRALHTVIAPCSRCR